MKTLKSQIVLNTAGLNDRLEIVHVDAQMFSLRLERGGLTT